MTINEIKAALSTAIKKLSTNPKTKYINNQIASNLMTFNFKYGLTNLKLIFQKYIFIGRLQK